MADENLTSSPTINSIEESQTDIEENDGQETEQQKEAADTVDYKTKFAESTREAQRLLNEQKILQEQLSQKEADLTDLQDSYNELENKFKEENPEGYEKTKIESELRTMKEKIVATEEETKLMGFISSESNAARHKEALRALGRSNPQKSYETLWRENFAAFYEDEKRKAEKKSQPETGKGAIVSGMPTGELPEKFNTWPLEKRQAWFKKKGIDTLP